MFTADVEGVDEISAVWQSALGDIADGMTRGVQRGVEDAAKEARASHLYRDRTGALTGSIRGYLRAAAAPVDGGEAVGSMEAEARYASFVEEGTSAHVIEAARAEALRWTDEGGTHFARRVNHPGSRSLPFMRPALLKVERVVEVKIELAVERAAQRFA